jgi:hypothetical protein
MVWQTLGCGGVGLELLSSLSPSCSSPLDHCFPLKLDHCVHLHVHLDSFHDLDQVLVWVECYHLGMDLSVVHLDLVALHHQ